MLLGGGRVVPTLSPLMRLRTHLIRLRMAGGSKCDMFLGATAGFRGGGYLDVVGRRSDYMYWPI
jgi:hypothetical protein